MSCIGIDLGTSGVKIIQVDKNGRVLAEVTKTYISSFPQTGYSEQNPEEWLKATIIGIQEVTQKAGMDVEAISFSGQMHGLVLLDKDDAILRPAILWNDQRTIKECEYLNKVIGIEKIGEWTSNQALTGFTAPKILWVKEHEPEIFDKIAKILLPKDYLIYALSGIFATDVSDASGTLYFDVENRKWSKEMLTILGINEKQVPKVFESFEVVGQICPTMSKKLKLTRDVNIVAGGGDQAIGAIGTGTVEEGMCSIALGTSGVVFVATEKNVVDPSYSLHAFCHANGKNHVMGVMLSAAGSLKWWYEDILGKSKYDTLSEELIKSDAKNLYFLPYLVGERTPLNDPNARGVFIGLEASTTSEEMTRAVLEGVCFALRDSFELMNMLNVSINRIRITGGGAKNTEWVKMLATILATPIETLEVEEGPAFGAAILAMVGQKIFPTIQRACEELIHTKEIINPNDNQIEYYETKYNKFKKIYPVIKELYKEI